MMSLISEVATVSGDRYFRMHADAASERVIVHLSTISAKLTWSTRIRMSGLFDRTAPVLPHIRTQT
jgi:hypothetical protein